jgi:hypothetical protein
MQSSQARRNDIFKLHLTDIETSTLKVLKYIDYCNVCIKTCEQILLNKLLNATVADGVDRIIGQLGVEYREHAEPIFRRLASESTTQDKLIYLEYYFDKVTLMLSFHNETLQDLAARKKEWRQQLRSPVQID